MAKLKREPTAEENQAATEAWRPFMVELKALLDKYGIVSFGACSCCDGLGIADDGGAYVHSVGLGSPRDGEHGQLIWEHGYTKARHPSGDDGAETSSNL